jgi:UDP-N-acetylglucosamine diphosphorylase / glucose-1-phosphate thymidylyltransferase / UDP-N-acetylgalactosamine diphosphorylase / glucosamine-1-phosphate N-acetyltransferase / galactosamine-1-phosphate N-acetyltransferase
MNSLALYLYDDARSRDWQPFSLTRPCGELLLGAHTFRDRAERLFGAPCTGHITGPHLHGFQEPDAAPVVEPGSIATTGPRLYLSSRAVVDWGLDFTTPARPTVLRVAGEAAGWYAPAGAPNPEPRWLESPALEGDIVDLDGRMLQHVWDLVAENPQQIALDHAAAATPETGGIGAAAGSEAATGSGHASGFQAIGEAAGRLRLGRGVTIEPGVVFDFTAGPIWLDDDVTIRAFTRLSGPAYVGRGSTLLGGVFAAISIGPLCKVHGEMEETVVLGYSNKAHDGFLGHAYLGRWVNLGAMTTNSDLKNNYGRIRMWTPTGDADTGLVKLGCLLGDHVKTGIGALLNTGTIVGAGSNLFGSELPPKYVPPFSWGSGSNLVAYDADRFLAVAETVMARREVSLGDGMRRLLREAWRLGREQA